MTVRIANWVKVKNTTYVKVMFEGSGEPSDEHDIIGIAFYGKAGNLIHGIGETRGEDKSEGHEPQR